MSHDRCFQQLASWLGPAEGFDLEATGGRHQEGACYSLAVWLLRGRKQRTGARLRIGIAISLSLIRFAGIALSLRAETKAYYYVVRMGRVSVATRRRCVMIDGTWSCLGEPRVACG